MPGITHLETAVEHAKSGLQGMGVHEPFETRREKILWTRDCQADMRFRSGRGRNLISGPQRNRGGTKRSHLRRSRGAAAAWSSDLQNEANPPRTPARKNEAIFDEERQPHLILSVNPGDCGGSAKPAWSTKKACEQPGTAQLLRVSITHFSINPPERGGPGSRGWRFVL